MPDLLMSQLAVVLQQVPVLGAGGGSEPFDDGQDLAELVVGDVGELLAVVLGDDEGVAFG